MSTDEEKEPVAASGEAVAAGETEAGSKINAESEAKAVSKAEIDGKADAGVKAEADSKTDAEGKAEAVSKTEIDGKADTGVKADAEDKTEADSKTEAEGKADTDSKTDAEGKTDTDGKIDTEGKTEASGKAGTDGKTEAAAEEAEEAEDDDDDEGDAVIGDVRRDVSLLTEYDVYLFKQGSHSRLFEKLGAHLTRAPDKVKGTYFAVWAPNAKYVSVVGQFNNWDAGRHGLAARGDGSGIWEGFIPGLRHGTLYKYHIDSNTGRYKVNKGDPFAVFWETPPATSPIVWDMKYKWGDGDWMKKRKEKNSLNAPISIYEMHLSSWKHKGENGNDWLSYRELAPELADYCTRLGFTHIEFLPVMEHPFGGSWGYQTVGYFAPTSRFGTPQDFMYLIDYLHQHDIGVILDWVPSHFPSDEHGLVYYDGTCLYEHADPKKGFHPDWKSYIFNYGRNEVQAFLLSSAIFWLDRYHADAIRVDAVASMLYLDYSRKEGEWIPNQFGGRENLEAIAFLKRMNEEIYKAFPDVQTIAEESTAWPMVSRPAYVGGLGFGMKWNMGWMHDTLEYMAKDSIYRKYHHSELTFSMLYAFTENYVLPLSHDEVVHGKNSLVNKMPGDDWRRLANLRLLLSYQFNHPGKKLLFMGGEFAQFVEWNHDRQLNWELTQWDRHNGIQRMVSDLNRIYRKEQALHYYDFEPKGFEWIDCNDWEQSILGFIRKGPDEFDRMLIVLNFTPEPRRGYHVGVPVAGFWEEVFNSDALEYGGSGVGNAGGMETENKPWHGHNQSLPLTLPPLGAVLFKIRKPEPKTEPKADDVTVV